MRITARFNVRGGVDSVLVAETGPYPADAPRSTELTTPI
jgi:hypothetical protein